MDNNYECWRISGTLSKSINTCPDGKTSTCVNLFTGDVCPKGMLVNL